jgi:hypothetical protein
MKTFSRAITIIIVLTFIPAASATAQITPSPTPAPIPVPAPAPIAPASRPNDAIIQLRTLLSTMNQQYGGGKVLVIPTQQIQPQDLVTLMEDMTVMCSIFDKKLAQSNLRRGMPFYGVTLPERFSLDSGSMGAMYVQGYGALFMTTVDFPLSPPETEVKEDTKEENADQIWEQMRQEIFSPQEAARRTPDRPEEKYEAEKVENLKTTLIKALVHAANIRDLKPDESVILTVTGSGVSSNVGKIVMNKNNQLLLHTKDRNIVQILGSPSLGDLGISSPTVLTIRAKKSYIDALAQNKISFDQFEEKIQILSYPSLGENFSRSSSPSFLPAGTTGYSLPTSTSIGVFEGRRSDRRSGRSSGIYDRTEQQR